MQRIFLILEITMSNRLVKTFAVIIAFSSVIVFAQEKATNAVSFKSNVFPIIKAKCLPCHSEDNFNPSELSLDSYDLVAKGGKHGTPFKAGKSDESLLIQKTGDEPPFGDKMPLNSKKKIREGRAVWLTPDEVKTIATWIDQGAKNN